MPPYLYTCSPKYEVFKKCKMTINMLRGVAEHMKKFNFTLISGPALAFTTFIIYLRTIAPGVWGFDSAEFASGVYSLGIVHPPGYPLYILIGNVFISLIPINNVAYKLNVLSAIFASATVLLLYEVVYRITHQKIISWSVSAFFAFTNYFWQMALVTEVYTLHTFFLALNLLVILSQIQEFRYWKLFLFSFTFGLSLCNHTSGILFTFGFLWLLLINFKLNTKNLLLFAPMILIFLIGLLPYLYFPIRASSNPLLDYSREYSGINLTTIRGVWWMISGQAYQYYAFGYAWTEIPNEIYHFIVYLWRNYLGIGVIIGLVGIYNLWRTNWKLTMGLLLIFSSNMIFFINYRVFDKDTMFLPAFLIWIIFMAEGLKLIVGLSNEATGKEQLLHYRQHVFCFLVILLPLLPLILNWKWVDINSMHSTDSFARHVFNNSSPKSVIIGEWSSAVILEYYQIVEGKRPDLIIYNRARKEGAYFYDKWTQGIPYQENIKMVLDNEINTICSKILTRKVYMIEYDSAYETQFEFIPNGDFFELKLKNDKCTIR